MSGERAGTMGRIAEQKCLYLRLSLLIEGGLVEHGAITGFRGGDAGGKSPKW